MVSEWHWTQRDVVGGTSEISGNSGMGELAGHFRFVGLGSGDSGACWEAITVEREETKQQKNCANEGGGREGGKTRRGGPGAFEGPFRAWPNDFVPVLTVRATHTLSSQYH